MAVDLVGKRFARWLVVSESSRKSHFECVCECGSRKLVRRSNLAEGRSKSCGCLMREVNKLTRRTHGASSGGKITAEYSAWIRMRDRCQNANSKSYSDYGGRGISVCNRWDRSFEAFLSDMGKRPSGKHSIERIDVNGDYEPKNCKWATRLEQARNKTSNVLVECDGRMVPMSVAAERNGIPYKTVASRLSKGWPPERAVSEAVDRNRQKAQFREERLVDVSKRTGIPLKTIQCRLRRGWSEDRAFSEPIHS